MELVILGFLMMKTLSQYEIKKALTRNLSPYYSPSLGSIQSALKRLIIKGFIICEVGIENGRKKNSYRLTELGRNQFEELMKGDFLESKFDTDSSTRMFFLGLLRDEDKLYILKKIVEYIEEILSEFAKEKESAKEKQIDDAFKYVAYYQLKALELAIEQYQTSKAFYIKQIDELERI